MNDLVEPAERVRAAIWSSFHASYALVNLAKKHAAEIGPCPDEAFDSLPKGIADEIKGQRRQARDAIRAEADRLFGDFAKTFAALAPLAHNNELLHLLIASCPLVVNGAGFKEGSPAAWAVSLTLRLNEIIRGAGDHSHDKWEGCWPALAEFCLPDADELRVLLEQNLTVMADTVRERHLLGQILGSRSTPLEADTKPDRLPDQDAIQESPYRFRRKGTAWDVRFADEHGLLANNHSGFEYIAALLRSPNRPVTATVLKSPPKGLMESKHTFQEAIDRDTMAAYQRRFNELGNEMNLARRQGNKIEEEKIQQEMAKLLAVIERSTGLSGRSRKLGSANPAQRAANAVRAAIGRAIEAISKSKSLPGFARHLERTIQYGSDITYIPSVDRDHPGVHWDA